MSNVIQRSVNIPAGAGYVSIRATIPAHYVKIYEQATRSLALDYTLPNDSFAQVYTTKAGDAIELVGHGRSGILGMSPDYAAVGSPVLGDIYLKLRTTAGAGTDVIVLESESEL